MPGWIDAGELAALERKRRAVVDVAGRQVALFFVDGSVRALDNTCVHRQRELTKGTILGDRVVCPGHQWAFNLETGYEAKMCRYQPVFATRVEDGRVLVADEPTAIPDDESTDAVDGPAA